MVSIWNGLSFDKLEEGLYTKLSLQNLDDFNTTLSASDTHHSLYSDSSKYRSAENIGYVGVKSFNSIGSKSFGSHLKSIYVKPDEVTRLESLLSNAFKKEVNITRIRMLPPTRKEFVKEVSYVIDDGVVYKVWVFKADPKKTIRELNAYHVVFNAGVPTGKPIGYEPMSPDADYPDDIAVLGGILNHAGESYNDLIDNLQLKPNLIFQTAISIARMIADYHVKLTLAKGEFEKYGVEVDSFNVRKELKERLFAGIGKRAEDAETLIRAMEDMCNCCSTQKVISHNDIRNENIVTLLQTNDSLGQTGPSYKQFGVIDWADIVWDSPFGDLQDFWVHHKRKSDSILTEGYDFSFSSVRKAYEDEFNSLGKKHSLYLSVSNADELIKSTVWNLLEMFDPMRKDPADVEQKATYHSLILKKELDALARMGLVKYSVILRRELRQLVQDKEYLTNIF